MDNSGKMSTKLAIDGSSKSISNKSGMRSPSSNNSKISGKFKESAYDAEGKIKNFFHKGPKNKWQTQLDTNIKNEIENKLSVEMRELGYL